ncbi:hypothetical protein ACFXKG_15285 [Streptomyces sp. NPDC059255]|uniref:hypothetical protein n=1 Tax=Streptomyces sp. NPDC059255 TaxID=3346793 RepID=UPI00368B1AE2
MICAHCDQPILRGRPATESTVETGSGIAPPVQRHLDCRPNQFPRPRDYQLPRR